MERSENALRGREGPTVLVLRSIGLFILAALLEIGGAWLVWQGVREHRGWVWIGAGIVALGLYGFAATLQPDSHFGQILAAYGGIFIAGALAWGAGADGYRPDPLHIIRGLICRGGGGGGARLPPRPLRHQRGPDLPGGRGRDHVLAPPLGQHRAGGQTSITR